MAGSVDLQPLADAMARAVDGHGIGGLAWAIAVGDDVTSGSAGWLDPHRREVPVPVDGVFRVASVTKPIAAVAALQLVDDGLIGLDDPIDAVLPELADRRVLVDPDGPVDGPTVPAARPLTLRDLLTFRCGLGMEFTANAPPLLARLWELGVGPGPTPPQCSADEYMARLADLPLLDQPGTRWRYHTGSDVAGVLVERLRGATLDEVLAERVFGPLAMTDTGFQIRPDRLDRFGWSRSLDDAGEPSIWDEPTGRWASPPTFYSGAAGLLSTTADLIAFGRALLGDRTRSGGRLLTAAMAVEMTTDQLTAEQRHVAYVDDTGSSVGWGLGVAVRDVPDERGWPPAGAFGWDGGLGSRWLVDPHQQVCAVILTTDGLFSPGVLDTLDEFRSLVGTALA